MARLDQKDLQLVRRDAPVDLNTTAYNYLGGEFLTNENDYIEVLIHDASSNFLESIVVDFEDYVQTDTGGIQLKTGTILRKAGYDRGRFVIKYNFLRKIAGSYENVLVDNQNQIWNGQYHVLSTGQIRTGDIETESSFSLYLKEYKYFIHAISDSRKEVRLAPQPINNAKYLKDFYYAQRVMKTIQSDGTDLAKIQFVNTDASLGKGGSNVLKLVDANQNFMKRFVGGTLTIPNVFITGFKEIPRDAPIGTATDSEELGTLQARFRLVRDGTFAERANFGGSFGDPYFRSAFSTFSGADGQSPTPGQFPGNILGTSGEHTYYEITPSGGNKMSTITRLKSGTPANFSPIHVIWTDNEASSTIVLESNSILPNLDIPTTYEWRISGWDHDSEPDRDNPKDYQDGWAYYQITPKVETEGNYLITGGSDPKVAVPSVIIPSVATTSDSTNGSFLVFQAWGKHVTYGISLTVSQATGVGENSTSTLFLPAIIERR